MSIKQHYQEKNFFLAHYGCKRFFWARFFSRLTDFVLVANILYLTNHQANFQAMFWPSVIGYYFLFSFFHGQTIGRMIWGIKYISQDWHFLRHFCREILFFLLPWIILLEILFTTRPFFHDRWLKIVVKR